MRKILTFSLHWIMQEKVESFPFNVTDNPMYYGSTLSFLATALWSVPSSFTKQLIPLCSLANSPGLSQPGMSHPPASS